MRRFSWETTSGMFPYSALFGTTVDAVYGAFWKKSHVFYVKVGLGIIPRGWCDDVRRASFAAISGIFRTPSAWT